MSDAQSANRFRLASILVMTSVIALSSFWLLEVMKKNTDESMPTQQRLDPDYYVKNFNFTRMSLGGQLKYRIMGERLIHFPANDSYQIVHPVMQSVSPDRMPVLARADMAFVENNRKKISLVGEVNADRAASAAGEKVHLTTDRLLILPDDNIMKTEQAVTITMGQSTLSGVGMLANNATQQLQLLSHVHGTIPPRPR